VSISPSHPQPNAATGNVPGAGDRGPVRKSIPDLAAVEVTSDVTHRYVAQLPDVLSKEEWLAKYGERKIATY
jgi:hypothetical protein